ncbi:MAG: GNAT family N-acetyltransferase [Candidatus Hodarchaeota archaeon]
MDIEEFCTICYNFLEEHEAENNLILGILETLRPNIYAYDPTQAPELVAIFDNKDIVLVSIRTPPYNQILSYTKEKDSIPVLVEFLAETGVEIPGVLGFKDGARLFAKLWTKKHGKKKTLNMNERIYKLDQVNPHTIGKNIFEVATEENLDLLIHYAQNFAQEAFANTSQDQIARNQVQLTKGMEKWITEKIIYVLKVDNHIVSMAKASRETTNGRSITLVYSPPKYRRKGYATELVAKLCQSILDEGKKYCFLFTDLANPTSNKIYMNVGFKPIMDVDEYRFE